MPIELRWRGPQYLKPINLKGKKLREWFPGRIVASGDEGVRVVVATPEENPAARRLIVKDLTRRQWQTYSRRKALPRPDTFIEVGTYEDDSVRIVRVPRHMTDQVPRLASARTLRYLRRWDL